MVIREVWEETGLSSTEFLDRIILPDSLTIVGFSSQAREDTMCREHVVPRILIIQECVHMLRDGKEDQALSELIRQNTKIVFVSPDERVGLESSNI